MQDDERIKSYAHGTHWFMFNLYATISWMILLAASVALFSWPITLGYLNAKCAEYEAVSKSIRDARIIQKLDKDRIHGDYELRGIQVMIAEWNGWREFWNELDKHPLMDYYIPERLHQLKPME